MPLEELAPELLLEIVDTILDDVTQSDYTTGFPTSRNSLSRLFPLSKTCKRLNEICGRRIFRQYRLTLHNTMTNEIHCPEPGTLSHALKKADHIQELTISNGDQLSITCSGYEDSILDALLELVNSMSRLISVTLHQDVLQLPPKFWFALLSKPIRHLDIHGPESVSPNLQISTPPVLDKLQITYGPNTERLLKVVRTCALSLRYTDIYMRASSPFEPTDSLLRDIHVELLAPSVTTSKFLDFSKVPQARIHVDVFLGPLSYLENEQSFQDLRKQLPDLFVENLSQFNVYRKFDSSFTVSRPSLVYYSNWKPMYQDQFAENSAEDLIAVWASKFDR